MGKEKGKRGEYMIQIVNGDFAFTISSPSPSYTYEKALKFQRRYSRRVGMNHDYR